MRKDYVLEKNNCKMTKIIIKNISNFKRDFLFDEILKN